VITRPETGQVISRVTDVVAGESLGHRYRTATFGYEWRTRDRYD
jgi:hypothetical protein